MQNIQEDMVTEVRTGIDQKQLWAEMQPGWLLLTVNRRLSLALRDSYNRYQSIAGNSAWETINTISWSDWVTSLYQDLEDIGQTNLSLLMPHQSRLLWEQIISSSDKGKAILYPKNTAEIAQDAWELMHAWEIDEAEISSNSNDENARFLEWASSYRSQCQKKRWIDSAQLPELIAQKLKDGELEYPDQIILAGFEEITPQQVSILKMLEHMGCKIRTLLNDNQDVDASRVGVTDNDQELELVAYWSLEKLQNNPGSRIGIVVPQLHQIRNHVEKIFRNCFYPVSILPGQNKTNSIYNISVGIALDNCPLVVDAITVLKLACGSIASGELSRLLRSPLLAIDDSQRSQNATLDAYMRRTTGERSVSLDTLIRNLNRLRGQDKEICAALLCRLELFRKSLDHQKQWQSPQNWVTEFNRILHTMGWPNPPSLNSIEYQQVECFNKLMTSFQMLGQIVPELSRDDAVARLLAMASETIFQPKTEAASIQISGLLEAAGQEFDYLWITGLTDDQWPSISSPNPLLPVSLQRQLGMPHSSPQREIEYAESLTERLLKSAPEVIFSHSTTDGTRELRPSPLITKFQLMPTDQYVQKHHPKITNLGLGQVILEQIIDENGPELQVGAHQSGGSWLLADQSACPFRAFAIHRLGASPLEDPTSGVDARSRGSMIHRILEKVWNELGSFKNLLDTPDNDLNQLITNAVEMELDKFKPQKPETLTSGFFKIEKERITNLISEWMELERKRVPFTIQALEKGARVTLGGLELDIIADRVDQLEDGRTVIIDYKTGKLKNQGWFEERIGEPQLPLYVTTHESDVAGVFLAGVSRQNLRFLGVTDVEYIVPGVKTWQPKKGSLETNWEELKTAWENRLELLANEVREGLAIVDPHDPVNDCRYCPLPSLCRIHEHETEHITESSE